MEIVLNEWLLHYSKHDADIKKKELVYKFLQFLKNNNFKLVIDWKCPFIRKFQTFWDASKADYQSHSLFKILYHLLIDSNKVKYVELDDVSILPDEVVKCCPGNDLYLMQLAFNSKDRVIITKDEKLIEKMSVYPELKIMSPEDFLKRYS